MKSIAIWYSPSKGRESTLSEVELHFNFWKIPNGTKKHQKFLDIGIKIEDTLNVDTLNLFFPSQITQNDFEDIVSKFIDKADLVSAIFNENYKVTSNATTKLYEINDSTNNFIFTVYKTSKNDIEFQNNKYGGTILKIKVLKQDKKTYYRFRLKGKFIDSLSTISKPTNSVLESAFSQIEMIDFRVNEIRDLNHDLIEEINKEVLLKIKKQHFFFICSNEEEVIGNHQPFISCRNLENYRWDNYVDLPENNKNNVYLAYHWKENAKESVSTLIKTKYEKNNWKTILKYFAVAFIIAVIIELFSNWLYDFLKGILTFKCN
ncbi:MAG TPA: hypothetical protein VFF27_04020 [Bacteroidia bacterium]|jgi:hypothetical protein|nr:hypothetical protein [Bacteroidia bacterium]